MELRQFVIPAPAGTLEGVTHTPGVKPRALAIVAHPLPTMGGTMENKVVTTLAKTFAELGFVALRFNFRGVGSSSGSFDNGEGEVEDALAVAGHTQLEYCHLPLVLAGFSFGGYVQARVAQELHPRHLVLIAPAVGRFEMPHVPHSTLVIHGEQDDVVPLSDVMQWARPQHLPIVILPEAGHFFHGRLNQVKEIVSHYFSGHSL